MPAVALRRIAGTDPTIKVRVCPACRYELPLAYFGPNTRVGTICHVCRDAKREKKPWTAQEITTLRYAAGRVLDLWPKYYDLWDADDLQRLRELVAAAGREDGVPVNMFRGAEKNRKDD